MALTKVTGQVIKNTTDVTVGVLTVTNTLAVGGTVSIGGTLTYEDVTNVDAVGLITARNGIVVGSGITLSKDGDVFFTGIATGNGSGLTAINASNIGSGTVPTARLGSGTASSSTFLRGDSTFQTVNTDLVSDTSPQLGGNLDVNTKNIVFGDSASSSDDRLQFGASQDLEIYHNGSASYIKDSGTGYLLVLASGFAVQNAAGSETIMSMVEDGAVDLYYNDSKKFETTSGGVTVTGVTVDDGATHDGDVTFTSANGNNILFDKSDNSLEFGDSVKAKFGAGGDLNIEHDGSNSYISDGGTGDLVISGSVVRLKSSNTAEDMVKATENGAVELYHNNVKKIETATEGVVIPSGGGNCLRVFGQNTSHATSALVIGQNSTTVSQLRAYGPDTSTNGQINFRASRSDGSSSINLTYNGNLQFDSGYGIDFSATANTDQTGSSMSSELFDDYEEGSWTPGNSDMGITNHYAYYTKVGRVVHIVMDITFASSPADSSQVGYVTQLPFDAGSFAQHVTVQWFGTSSVNNNGYYNTWMQTYVASGDDKLSILDARYGTYVTRATLAGKKLRANFWYVAT
jgi:hypothetical protein